LPSPQATTIGSDAPVGEAYRLLIMGSTGVLATHRGWRVGQMARIDLVDFPVAS